MVEDFPRACRSEVRRKICKESQVLLTKTFTYQQEVLIENFRLLAPLHNGFKVKAEHASAQSFILAAAAI